MAASRPAIIFLVGIHLVLLLTLLFAPSIARQTHSARTIPNFPCYLSDFTRAHCAGPKDCLYVRPGSCIDFVECRWHSVPPAKNHWDLRNRRKQAVGDETGVRLKSEAIVHRCPRADPRLEWNDLRKRCDYPGTKGTCGEHSVGRELLEDVWSEQRSQE